MLYLPYIGMPNILAGEQLVPELIQGRATPAALSAALLELLRDTALQERQVHRFREMHELLRQDNAQKAADAVLEVLDAGRA
jgi:lipid-A-disaccharide synthase